VRPAAHLPAAIKREDAWRVNAEKLWCDPLGDQGKNASYGSGSNGPPKLRSSVSDLLVSRSGKRIVDGAEYRSATVDDSLALEEISATLAGLGYPRK
jgi:hypothetical protein